MNTDPEPAALFTETKTTTPVEVAPTPTASEREFGLAQRQAKALAASDLVPQAYRNNLPNVLLALEVANRIGASPFGVMQNLHMIQGRPSWSSSFLIASVNSCDRFEPLRFAMIGTQADGEAWGCFCWTKAKGTEEIYEGPPVTMAMAKAEGWSTKSGSKWKTLPDLMLRYRAASFFSRLYAPELTLGLQTTDEVRDVTGAYDTVEVASPGEGAGDQASLLNAGIEAAADPGEAHPAEEKGE